MAIMDKPMEEGQTIHHEVFDEIHNYNSRPDWITEEVVLTDSVQSWIIKSYYHDSSLKLYQDRGG